MTDPSPLGSLASVLASRRILVLGDVILDEYVAGSCERISPEAPVPVVEFQHFRRVLGGAANAAANVASLGCQVTLVAVAGRDPAGKDLEQLCREQGIDYRPVTDEFGTTRKQRVTAHQQQLFRLDYEHHRGADAERDERLWAEIEAAWPDVDVVVMSDYAKGCLSEALCRRVIAAGRAAGKPTVVDPRPQHRHFYAHCDYMTPNWKEAQGLLGQHDRPMTDEEIDRTAKAVATRFDCGVLLTLGPRGIAFCSRDQRESFVLPSAAREVFDVSGAGDTVVAAFSAGIAAGFDRAAAINFANRAAAVVVGRHGTATVTLQDLAASEPPPSSRLIAREALAPLADALRGRQQRIVTVNGSFDVLHAGHLHILEDAKRQGDVLIVGLNSDASVRGYKGAGRPIVPEAERAALLLALRVVDYVHIFPEADPIAFLSAVRPAVHVNGAEYGEACIEADAVRRGGGRLHLVPRLPGLSTSGILEKLQGRGAS